MIYYKRMIPFDVQVTRPDFSHYLLLDREFGGCKRGLEAALSYIRDSYMINNDDFRFMFMEIGVKEINDMEVFAKLLHQMHGSDDRYYDESNDDTPTHELIPPCEDRKEGEHSNNRHVNNDITACIMFHLQAEEKEVRIYQELSAKIDDVGARAVFDYIVNGKKDTIHILRGILNTLTKPNEIKDFGLGYDSHNAFSPNSGNYIDKPNPEFLNPSEVEHLQSK